MGLLDIFSNKNVDRLIESINKLLGIVDNSVLIFREGVKNYIYSDESGFSDNLSSMASLEAEAGALFHEIESTLYTRGYLIRSRGDIMRLLERFEHIVSIISADLIQFEIESPTIPAELKKEFIKLAELATLAVKLSQSIKRTVFHDMDGLKLSEKFHLRYFALHIEDIAKAAVKVAEQLSVMTIKRAL